MFLALWLFISLAERDAMMASLQVELREARDQSRKVQETLAQVQQSQESELSTELPVRHDVQI